MKKVLIIHGLGGSPNGGWRPWVMGEMQKMGVWACALAMLNPDQPVLGEWVAEIARNVERSAGDEIYLVGHSLGVTAILRYLESKPDTHAITGAVLVSGRCGKVDREDLKEFFEPQFNFARILSRVQKFAIIHGDTDTVVPVESAHVLSEALHAPLTIVPNGGHLNGSAGWLTLPPCIEALKKMLAA